MSRGGHGRIRMREAGTRARGGGTGVPVGVGCVEGGAVRGSAGFCVACSGTGPVTEMSVVF